MFRIATNIKVLFIMLHVLSVDMDFSLLRKIITVKNAKMV